MIRKFLFIFIVSIIFNGYSKQVEALKNEIIVKIDNNIITTYELKNKLKTSLLLSNQEINQINIDKNKKRALTYLINLKLKKNELAKYKFEIDKINVNSQLLALSSNDINNFKNRFNEFGINYDLFVNELKIETAWKQLMFKIYNEKVKINQKEVDKQVADYIKKSTNINELKISDIEINLDQNSDYENEVKFFTNEIEQNGFENTAFKYSVSSSAVNYGNIGWVNSDSINKKINKELNKLQVGEISSPIRNLNTLIFLKITDKRVSKIDDVNAEKFKKKLTNQKKNELFNLYSRSHLSKLKNNSLIEYK